MFVVYAVQSMVFCYSSLSWLRQAQGDFGVILEAKAPTAPAEVGGPGGQLHWTCSR